MSALRLAGVSKRYGAVPALSDLDLDVPAGSRMAVVGPSGSGKTTLLRLVAGFERPDRGRVELGGTVLAEGARAVPVHRRGIGIVAQDGALFPHLCVADNIGFGLPRRAPGRAAAILGLMASVELDAAHAAKRPHELSGGQQQRVALARALALRPRLMLLDEPFSALDAGLREATRRSVAAILGEAGVTTILVTHDHAEALSFADRVAVLRAGRLIQAGPPRDLYLRPADPAVATLLGDAVILPADLGDGVATCLLGSVPAVTGGRRGPASILLRPGQVALRPAPCGATACGRRARVVAVEFGGGSNLVALRVEGEPDRATLDLRMPGDGAPAIGTEVEIVLHGPAHVFPEGAA